MRYLVFLLMFVIAPAQAIVTLTGKTHAKNELVECADGTWWSKCLPGNEVVTNGAGALSLAHLDNITTSDPYYINMKNWVDASDLGTYGYVPTNAAFVSYISGDTSYLTRAIAEVDQQVDDEIAAYPSPNAAYDSYLYAHHRIESLSVAYTLGYDQLTTAQRTKWENYANQVLFNIWNHSSAEWGGVSNTWSGWATTNPDNNYFYGFTKATVMWALASGNQTWIDQVNDYIAPLLSGTLANTVGGGSLEGFNYGMAQRYLGQALIYWANSTGVRIDNGLSFSRDNIAYWTHATTPDSLFAHPSGDMARTSTSDLYDYMPQLIRTFIALEPSSIEAEWGRWQLPRYTQFSGGYSRAKDYLFDVSGTATQPAPLQYHADRLGDYFARSDWTTSAMWLWLHNGERSESHSAQQQGDFALYKNGWLTYNGNYASDSGINQSTDRFNIIRFERGGSSVAQLRSENDVGTVTPTVNGSDVNVVMNVSDLYNDSDVTSWVRTVDFNGSTVTIDDVTTHAGDITPIFQINTPTAPTINGTTITAGNLQIVVNAPASPSIVSESWASLAGDSNTVHRISISGGSNYNVTLSEI